MKTNNPKLSSANKIIHKHIEDPLKIQALRAIKAAKTPNFADSTWALLMAEAIKSFNQGLEDYIDVDDRRTASNLREKVINVIGEEAHNIIAFVVTAQRRPLDVYAQASSIYTRAMANLKDQQALFTASKQLYDLSKSPGIDPETAAKIAGLAANLQEQSSAATAYAGGTGVGGMSQSGMPTGVTIQGSNISDIMDKWDEEFFSTRQ